MLEVYCVLGEHGRFLGLFTTHKLAHKSIALTYQNETIELIVEITNKWAYTVGKDIITITKEIVFDKVNHL